MLLKMNRRERERERHNGLDKQARDGENECQEKRVKEKREESSDKHTIHLSDRSSTSRPYTIYLFSPFRSRVGAGPLAC